MPQIDLDQLRSDLRSLKGIWARKLNLASDRKWDEFGKFGVWCEHFYSSTGYDLMEQAGLELAQTFSGFELAEDCPHVRTNLVYQMVDTYVPYIHYRNPTRTVSDAAVDLPPDLKILAVPQQQLQQIIQTLQMNGVPPEMMQQMLTQLLLPNDELTRAQRTIKRMLLEPYLNYTPRELDLVGESHLSLTDALVIGAGVWWNEILDTPRGRLCGSFHDSIDHLQIDPDFPMLRQSQWISRERVDLAWRLEERWKLPYGTLSRNRSDTFQNTVRDSKADNIAIKGTEYRKSGGPATPDASGTRGGDSTSNELVTYFEIYSRCGIGAKMAGAPRDLADRMDVGDNVYLVITDACEYPLNFHPDRLEGIVGPEIDDIVREIRDDLQWHTPFHKDHTHPWPMVMLGFHPQRHSVWPISHVRPALGEQIIIDWICCQIAARIKKAVGKNLFKSDLDEGTRHRLFSPFHENVPIDNTDGSPLESYFMRIPPDQIPADLYQAKAMFEQGFAFRTGLFPEISGGAPDKQMRSSFEAQMRQQLTQSRPESMAERYAIAQSLLSRNEAIMARYHVDAKAIAAFMREDYSVDDPTALPQIGPLTQLWAQLVHSDNFDDIVAEFEYRIEADSMKKPNVSDQLAAMGEAGQIAQPALMHDWQTTGDPSEINKWFGTLSKLTGMPPIELHDLRQAQMEMMMMQQEMGGGGDPNDPSGGQGGGGPPQKQKQGQPR